MLDGRPAGRLVRARRSLSEIGRTVLVRADEDGVAGTVEALASGTALNQDAAKAGRTVAGAELVARVPSVDAVAITVLDDVEISATVVNLAHQFSLDVTVVGSRLGRNFEMLGWRLRAPSGFYGSRDLAAQIVVSQASLGHDSGLGVAGWNAATGVTR